MAQEPISEDSHSVTTPAPVPSHVFRKFTHGCLKSRLLSLFLRSHGRKSELFETTLTTKSFSTMPPRPTSSSQFGHSSPMEHDNRNIEARTLDIRTVSKRSGSSFRLRGRDVPLSEVQAAQALILAAQEKVKGANLRKLSQPLVSTIKTQLRRTSRNRMTVSHMAKTPFNSLVPFPTTQDYLPINSTRCRRCRPCD